MSSKNGKPELISLLQYMKETSLDNPGITVKDKRLVELEENQEIVEKICAIAASYTPDYDCDKICLEWEKKR